MSVIYKNGTYYGAGGGGEGADTEIIADDFDPTESYAVGEYVVYEGVLYKCTTAHTGAWDASDFEDTQVMAEMPTPMPAADMSDIVTPLPGVMSRLQVYRNLVDMSSNTQVITKELVGITEDGYNVYKKIYTGVAEGTNSAYQTIVSADSDLNGILQGDVLETKGHIYSYVQGEYFIMQSKFSPIVFVNSGNITLQQGYTSKSLGYHYRVEVTYVDRPSS